MKQWRFVPFYLLFPLHLVLDKATQDPAIQAIVQYFDIDEQQLRKQSAQLMSWYGRWGNNSGGYQQKGGGKSNSWYSRIPFPWTTKGSGKSNNTRDDDRDEIRAYLQEVRAERERAAEAERQTKQREETRTMIREEIEQRREPSSPAPATGNRDEQIGWEMLKNWKDAIRILTRRSSDETAAPASGVSGSPMSASPSTATTTSTYTTAQVEEIIRMQRAATQAEPSSPHAGSTLSQSPPASSGPVRRRPAAAPTRIRRLSRPNDNSDENPEATAGDIDDTTREAVEHLCEMLGLNSEEALADESWFQWVVRQARGPDITALLKHHGLPASPRSKEIAVQNLMRYILDDNSWTRPSS